MVRRICFPMYWASPSGVVAIRLFLRGDRRRDDWGLSGATMRSLFFCGRGAPPLFFYFEGPRERDFRYSNHSVRSVSSP